MSAVRVAQSRTPRSSTAEADVQAMQDVLYDLLALGVDPDQQDVPSAQIESFLHEHARAPKGREEFLSFFATHGLSLRTSMAYAATEVRLPPLARAEEEPAASVSFPQAHALAEPEPEPATGAHRALAAAAAPRSGVRIVAWSAAALALALVGLAGWYGYATVSALRGELQRVRGHAERDRQAVQALRDHAAGLESSVAATSELVQRVDQKSDLLLESLLPPPHSQPRRKRQ